MLKETMRALKDIETCSGRLSFWESITLGPKVARAIQGGYKTTLMRVVIIARIHKLYH
jgi:hypothetical protein